MSYQPAWVSVTDRLPPYGELVAVATRCLLTFGRRRSTDVYGDHWEGEYDPSSDSREIREVTHWLALPDAP